MIKFDLGLPPNTIGKEVMPRLEKVGLFYAVRKGTLLQIFSSNKQTTFQYKVPEHKEFPEALLFKEGKHAKHVIECYKTGKAILIPYDNLLPEEIPELIDFGSMEVINNTSLQDIKSVMHSASVDSIRPSYNGVCLFVGENIRGISTTDGSRMSFKKCDLKGLDQSVIIPLDFLKIVQSDIEVLVNDSQVFIRSGNVITKAVEGVFPNVGNVIPDGLREYIYSITVTDLEALKGYYDLLAEPSTTIVFLGSEKIKIKVEGEPVLDLKYHSEMGEPVAFNFQKLLDALTVFPTLIFKDSRSPVIFENGNHMEIVMPLTSKQEKSE